MVHVCSKCEKFKVCTYTFFGMIDIVVHICVLGGFCFYIAKNTKCANCAKCAKCAKCAECAECAKCAKPTVGCVSCADRGGCCVMPLITQDPRVSKFNNS